jgi:hypothetical protein
MAPKPKTVPLLQVELMLHADRYGHRHVSDPTLGMAATFPKFGVVFRARGHNGSSCGSALSTAARFWRRLRIRPPDDLITCRRQHGKWLSDL